jgi:PAP2 superfamily protein
MIVPVLFTALVAQSTANAVHSDTTLARLPARVAHDTRQLVTRAPLLTLGIGAALSAATHPADNAVERHLPKFGTVDESLDAGSAAGDGWVQWTTAGVVYGTGLVLKKPRVADVGTRLVEAQLISGVFTQVVKYGFDRKRPDGGTLSYPSGHTSSSFATADILEQQYGWKIGALAYGAAACVSVSRLAEHQHYLSDIVFGAAIGIASARATGQGHVAGNRALLRGFTIVPIATRGGAAILLTKTVRPN